MLVVSLEGWIDAGLGASTAISTMLNTISTEVLATFDTEYFIDQRARRPLARIVDGITTELTWPEIQLRYGRDGDGADILFLVGPEPDFHWSDFIDVVTDAAGRFDVRLVVGLGAFPAPTPHTRPVRVIATAPEASAHLLPIIGTVTGELEVPAGISAALELGFAEVDMEIVTLWARVPHYVAAMPYPQASAALIDGLARIAGLTLDASHLRASADEARQRVDDLVTNNPEHSSMVEQLEEAADETEGTSLGEELPSGDDSPPSSNVSCAASRVNETIVATTKTHSRYRRRFRLWQTGRRRSGTTRSPSHRHHRDRRPGEPHSRHDAPSLHVEKLDITTNDVDKVHAWTIDVLVNNAGSGRDRPPRRRADGSGTTTLRGERLWHAQSDSGGARRHGTATQRTDHHHVLHCGLGTGLRSVLDDQNCTRSHG